VSSNVEVRFDHPYSGIFIWIIINRRTSGLRHMNNLYSRNQGRKRVGPVQHRSHASRQEMNPAKVQPYLARPLRQECAHIRSRRIPPIPLRSLSAWEVAIIDLCIVMFLWNCGMRGVVVDSELVAWCSWG
jgi:hypothetical protein